MRKKFKRGRKNYTKGQIEDYLLTMLDTIRNYDTGIKQTSNDVWGKDVRRIQVNKKDNYIFTDCQELENWYINFRILENVDEDGLRTLIKQLKGCCYEKDCGGIPLDERQNYTCYQLCDWTFLESEEGFILKERESVIEAGVSYCGTIVKYAKILKNLEVEQ